MTCLEPRVLVEGGGHGRLAAAGPQPGKERPGGLAVGADPGPTMATLQGPQVISDAVVGEFRPAPEGHPVDPPTRLGRLADSRPIGSATERHAGAPRRPARANQRPATVDPIEVLLVVGDALAPHTPQPPAEPDARKSLVGVADSDTPAGGQAAGADMGKLEFHRRDASCAPGCGFLFAVPSLVSQVRSQAKQPPRRLRAPPRRMLATPPTYQGASRRNCSPLLGEPEKRTGRARKPARTRATPPSPQAQRLHRRVRGCRFAPGPAPYGYQPALAIYRRQTSRPLLERATAT